MLGLPYNHKTPRNALERDIIPNYQMPILGLYFKLVCKVVKHDGASVLLNLVHYGPPFERQKVSSQTFMGSSMEQQFS